MKQPRRIHLATGQWRREHMVLSPTMTVHISSERAACGRYMIDKGQFSDELGDVTCDNCRKVARGGG